MTQVGSETVEVEVRIAARPETVFSFLSDGPGMARWFGSKVDLDPRPGGELRVDYARVFGTGKLKVVEIVRNQRLVFTFGWEGEGHPVPPGSTTVEISLTEDGDATIVRLRHSDLSAEQARGHKEGWEHFLPRLVEVGEGRDPGPDPWAE